MKNILILFLLVTSLNSNAADGTLFYFKGKVLVDGINAKKLQKLTFSQTITVSKSSLAIISMENGSKLKVNENSSIKLVSPRITKTSKINITELLKGSVFVKFKANKKNRFNLKTKNVSMGVRGTEFFASYGRSDLNDVWMCVNEGLVSVKGKKDKKSVLVKAGEGIVSKKGEKTSSPKSLPWTSKLNWNLNPEVGELKNRVNIEEAYSDPLDVEYD